MTPTDDYAFVGDPPLFRPKPEEIVEVHVSCTFTWDIPETFRLAEAWGRYYPTFPGGCAFKSLALEFVPGLYVRHGVTFTSRGCNNQCPWCLVPVREWRFREIEIHPGNNILDNNILQCSKDHWNKVVDMLRSQHGVQFSGGLDSRLLTDRHADDLRSLRIKHLFFACDTEGAIKPLERAKQKLPGFTRQHLRCYVLLAFRGETISEAQERLEAVWGIGFLPFAQLYQPPDHYINYPKEWRDLAKAWSRPAITKAIHRIPSPHLEAGHG